MSKGSIEIKIPDGDNVVTQVRFDYAFTLVIGDVLIRIEVPFVSVLGQIKRVHDCEDPGSQAPLLGLHNARIASAFVGERKELHVVFDNDDSITVEANDAFEAFSASYVNDQSLATTLVSTPGGELTVFSAPR